MPFLQDRIKAIEEIFKGMESDKKKHEEVQKSYQAMSDEDLEMSMESNPWHLGLRNEMRRRKKLRGVNGE